MLALMGVRVRVLGVLLLFLFLAEFWDCRVSNAAVVVVSEIMVASSETSEASWSRLTSSCTDAEKRRRDDLFEAVVAVVKIVFLSAHESPSDHHLVVVVVDRCAPRAAARMVLVGCVRRTTTLKECDAGNNMMVKMQMM